MLIPISILKEYIEIEEEPNVIADKLTMAGLEVEEIEKKYDDFILSIKIPSNRPDCLSIIGIVNELSAILNVEKKFKIITKEDKKEDIKNFIEVKIENKNLCRRYAARIIKNIKVAPSPDWLKIKLEKLGIRPINNIVDATNYICLLLGQPLHAFDYALIEGKKIIVRCARDNERIVTLDEVEHKLDNEILVIADENKPIAIAGVIGGKNTEINNNTNTILLESANFNAQSVRKTAKKLNILTESSYRFERNLDPNNVIYAIDEVAALILDIAGGELIQGRIDIYENKLTPYQINFRPSRCNYILGKDIEEETMINILNRLGFEITKSDDVLKVTPPTSRSDIKEEIDLIEEIARIYGYDQFEETQPISRITPARQDYNLFIQDKIKEIFTMLGFTEVITNSLTDEAIFDKCFLHNDKKYAVYLKNPMLKNYALMRTTILPNLLEVTADNIRKGRKHMEIFEIGKVYKKNEEINTITGLIIKEGVDFYYSKGIITNLLQRLGIRNYTMSVTHQVLYDNKICAKILIDNQQVGYLGKLKKEILNNFDIKYNIYAFEINLDNIKKFINLKKEYRKISKFPQVIRDIAVVVKEDIENATVENVIRQANIEELVSIEWFDLYKGDKIDKGYKSLAYSLVFNASDRTLTKKEVDKYVEEILNLLNLKLNAKIRDK